MSEPAFRYDLTCGCSVSIYANVGDTTADFSILGDKAPGIEWVMCPLHTAADDLLAALKEILPVAAGRAEVRLFPLDERIAHARNAIAKAEYPG